MTDCQSTTLASPIHAFGQRDASKPRLTNRISQVFRQDVEWKMLVRLFAMCPVFGIAIHHARTVANGVVLVHQSASLVVESQTFFDTVNDGSEVVAVNVEP